MTRPSGFRYPRAPIAEAVLEVQVTRLAPFELERLGGFDDPSYVEAGHSVRLENTAEETALGVATSTSRAVNGYRFVSDDELQVVMMRDDGFTFGRQAPYEDWVKFSTEALRLWASYVALARPEQVIRLGLRYINQIVLPLGETSIDKYLLTRPEISEGMPTDTVGFYLSMDIPLVEYDALCRVIETAIAVESGENALVLDIDVGTTQPYDPQDAGAIEAAFHRLRDAKNLVFEASITDEARSLFT